MGGSSKESTVGYRYFLGLHMGVCKGPIDLLNEIRIGDRTAWIGGATSNQTITIDSPNLFGGEEKEGGVQGALDLMLGGATQGANAYLTAKQGTPQPGYRGVFSAVFNGGLVGVNNPYLKPWAFRVRRILAGWRSSAGTTPWYSAKAEIALPSSATAPVVFATDFSDRGLYTTSIGNGGLFTISAGTYGPQMDVAAQNVGTPARIFRPIVSVSNFTALEFKAVITASNPDDAPSLYLTDAADVLKIGFVPRREAAFDAARRPGVFTTVPSATTLFGTAVTIGTWYKYRVELQGSNTLVTITDLSTGAVHATTTISGTGSFTGIAKIWMSADTGGLTCPGSYADVRIEGSIAGVGMNPAHIVYECLTNLEWGMGYDPALINDTNFRAAADIFYSEGMGLCLKWSRQQPIQQFVQVVLDHCGAVLGQDPTTGLFELTPLRGNYVVGSLPLFDESNIQRLEQYEKASPAELTNEVQVAYEDLATGQGGSVRVQNLATITSQGGVVSSKKSYPGLATADLAQRVAMRDLLAASAPLARMRAFVNRTAYTLKPGGMIRFSWAKEGVVAMAVRILRVNYGRLGEGLVGIEGVEDAFGVPSNTYAAQQPPGWTPPNTAAAAATNRVVREATYFEVVRTLGATAAAALDTDAGFVVAAALRPSGDSLDFGIFTRVGAAEYEQQARETFCPSGTISAQLEAWATTVTVTPGTLVDTANIGTSSYAQLGQEIIRIDSWDPVTGVAGIGRGLFGSTPKAHAAATRVYFLDGFVGADATERIDGEAVNVKLTPRTGLGELPNAEAPTDTVVVDAIQARPHAPGQLRINGLLYPPSTSAAVAVTWKHRDRLQQNLEGDESGDIGPEASTTYNAWLRRDNDGTILDSTTGVSGTSWTPTAPTLAGTYRIEVEAVRGGITSWQKAVATFRFEILTASVTLITSGASGGSGQGGAAPDRLLTASASLITGTATGGGPA